MDRKHRPQAARRRATTRRRQRSALQSPANGHTKDAARLSEQLGGLDRRVKHFFFSMTPSELKLLLDDYEAAYGRSARYYCERSIPEWRAEERQMSGSVAQRLFALVPQRMPASIRLAMVAKLWGMHSPISLHTISFGPLTQTRAVGEELVSFLTSNVTGHDLPTHLLDRFQWLAGGDARLMRSYLNHGIRKEREDVVRAVVTEVKSVLEVLADSTSATIENYRREVSVRDRRLHVVLDLRMEDRVAVYEGFWKPASRVRRGLNRELSEVISAVSRKVRSWLRLAK